MRYTNYSRHIFCIGLLIIILLLLPACAPTTASENEIQNEISVFDDFNESGLSITAYSETKRRTDKENKSDTIWVNIIAESDIAEYRASYVLYYTEYNSGWILDNINRENATFCAKNLVDNDTIKSDIIKNSSTIINDYELVNIKIEDPVVIQSDLSDSYGLPFVCYSVACVAENETASFEANFLIYYVMRLRTGWELQSCEMSEYSYAAKELVGNETIKSDIIKHSSTIINDYKLVNIEIEDPVVIQSDLSDSCGFPFACYSVACDAENEIASFEANFLIYYEMHLNDDWKLRNIEITEYSYTAKNKPSDLLVANILCNRNGICTLISEKKIYANEYVFYFSVLDNISCDCLTITWSDALTFRFDPILGWHLASIGTELENMEVDFIGKWYYEKDSEYFELLIHQSSAQELTIEYDLLFSETHIWGIEQTCELSTDGSPVTHGWSYVFDSDLQCFTFKTTNRLFGILWDGGLSKEDYYLEYRAYLYDPEMSGFYVDGRLLTKAS